MIGFSSCDQYQVILKASPDTDQNWKVQDLHNAPAGLMVQGGQPNFECTVLILPLPALE